MARIRTVKPEFWTDEKVVRLSPLARLLFIGLWNFVDDEGRTQYSPNRLKLQILPADNAEVSELIGEIRGEGLVQLYVVDNKEYLQVTGFKKHQKVDKRLPSKLPPPNHPEEPRITPLEWKGREGNGRDQGRDQDLSPSAPTAYVFEKGTIRLTAKDFASWQAAFSAIDLRAELEATYEWAAQQENWFHALKSLLAKRNREALDRRAAIKLGVDTATKTKRLGGGFA